MLRRWHVRYEPRSRDLETSPQGLPSRALRRVTRALRELSRLVTCSDTILDSRQDFRTISLMLPGVWSENARVGRSALCSRKRILGRNSELHSFLYGRPPPETELFYAFAFRTVLSYALRTKDGEKDLDGKVEYDIKWNNRCSWQLSTMPARRSNLEFLECKCKKRRCIRRFSSAVKQCKCKMDDRIDVNKVCPCIW